MSSIKKNLKWGGVIGLVLILVVFGVGCQGAPGETGPQGPPGSAGAAGTAGPAGEPATATVFALRFDSSQPGCGGVCHEAAAPYIQPNPEGKYTLAYEANHAWVGHDFDPLGELKTLDDCLGCHAVGTGDRDGKGNVSSKSLRDIVHKVHVSSPHFEAAQLDPEVLEEGERPGDCFTCHVVTGSSTTGLY